MNASLLLDNVFIWSLQIALLTGIAALLPAVLGMRVPRVKLAFLQIALLVCLLIPALRPWKEDAAAGAVTVSTTVVQLAQDGMAKSHSPIPVARIVLLLLAAGILVRFGFLLSGLVRLRRYRFESRPLTPARSWGVEAELRVSEEVTGPVTFGFRRPTVLLPAQFLSLDEGMQDAILCHEILHVRRRDWLLTVGEEFIRAVFWFHPAVWWLLREIQLVREQAVDRAVVEMTKSRDRYIDALLVIAGAPQSDLAPAPLFLRKRHLKQRVASILKEVRMSTAKSVSALSAGVTLVAASCWFITVVFPLHAAPQIATDAPGVTCDVRGAALLHRDPVLYPADLQSKGIQGTVVADLKLDSSGNVSDATIANGPDELRRPVLQSVLNWHFAPGAGATREISVTFALPAAVNQPSATSVIRPNAIIGGVGGGIGAGVGAGVVAANSVVKSISITGLSDQARDQLSAQLPVSVGQTLTVDNFTSLVSVVRAFDSHLAVRTARASDTEIAITIARGQAPQLVTAPPPPPPPPPPSGQLPTTDAVRIGGDVAATKLINQPKPVYPPLAKAAHVQGVVEFQATIGKDGKIQNLQLLSGPPLLVQAAMQAVQQWVYEPTLLNGNPVGVITTIDVNFTLAD